MCHDSCDLWLNFLFLFVRIGLYGCVYKYSDFPDNKPSLLYFNFMATFYVTSFARHSPGAFNLPRRGDSCLEIRLDISVSSDALLGKNLWQEVGRCCCRVEP